MTADTTIHRALWERLAPGAATLVPSVVPLFVELPGRAPRPVGSGVLVRVGPARLVLTASHVVDNVKQGPAFFLGPGGPVGLQANSAWTGPTPTGPPDVHDVGLLRLLDDCGAEFDEAFLRPDRMMLSEPVEHLGPYLALGYPKHRIWVDTAGQTIRSKPFRYLSFSSEPDVYAQLGRTAASHVVIFFDRGRVLADTGDVKVGLPTGMSGGGLWKWCNTGDRYALPDLRLVGIMTDYFAPQKAIAATRIRSHLMAIRKVWPDLQPHLEGFQIDEDVLLDPAQVTMPAAPGRHGAAPGTS